MSLPLGRFHEISLSTRSLETSIAFYERLGFVREPVLPVWPHPYAVVCHGRLTLGLHEYRFPSPSFTTVVNDLAGALEAHREAGMHLAFVKAGPDCFNEFGFRDPHGHMVTLLERATHGVPSAADADGQSLAPQGALLSLPAIDRELGLRFWEVLGAQRRDECRWDDRLAATCFEVAGITMALHDAEGDERPVLVIPGKPEPSTSMSPEGLTILGR